VREADGVELVLHAASDPHYRSGAGDAQQTRNLLAPCTSRHFVYVSIVGIDRIPYAYYRHKLECERLIPRKRRRPHDPAGNPFHELIEAIFTKLARWPLAPLPPRARV
jgi:hypothetical protein